MLYLWLYVQMYRGQFCIYSKQLGEYHQFVLFVWSERGFEIVKVCVRKIGLDTHQGVDLSPSWLAQYFYKRLVSMCSTKEIEILTSSKSQYVFINKSWLFSNSSEHSTWVCDWSTNNFHFSLNIHWLSGSLHSNPFVAKLISRA